MAAIFLIWVGGFIWFTMSLPGPGPATVAQAAVVPTGGTGRIAAGLDVLNKDLAPIMLVSGVDGDVKPAEFAAEFGVSELRMECCITLGFLAIDTHSNATETAAWVKDRDIKSLRLITTDWHMRRAAGELERVLPEGVTVIRDAVPSEPGLPILFLEYHKLLASKLAGFLPS
ncbi:MAG: YdcF family protein [Marinomonas sp.]